MDIAGKNVMVTGGAGFIGSHLVDALAGKGTGRIVVVDNFFLGKQRNLADAEKSGIVTVVNADAGDYAAMEGLLKKHDIDVVFNLAVVPLPTSLVRPVWSFNENVRITLAFAELLRKEAYDTLVQYSSSEVYGTAVQVPMGETHPLYPHTPYAASKAACDHLVFSYVKTYGIDASMVRPFNNYGPRQNEGSYAGVIPVTIKRIMEGGAPVIYGDGNQTRDFTYVTDTADATIRIYENESTRGRVVNLGSGRETSVKRIVELIAREMGCRREIRYESERIGDVRRHLADIGLARRLIGYEPGVSMEEGIKKTVAWYSEALGKKKA